MSLQVSMPQLQRMLDVLRIRESAGLDQFDAHFTELNRKCVCCKGAGAFVWRAACGALPACAPSSLSACAGACMCPLALYRA